MLDVCLLGCGGMMPLPRRWLTALMLRYNGSRQYSDRLWRRNTDRDQRKRVEF